MREFKFRIYSKDYGMQYPKRYLLSAFDFGVATDHYIDDSTSFYPITDKDNVLMQYTGLKDKNGKEIYEGDLINSFQNDYQPTEVYWDESLATYCTQNYHSTLTLIDSMNIETEIVGNIYENPELL